MFYHNTNFKGGSVFRARVSYLNSFNFTDSSLLTTMGCGKPIKKCKQIKFLKQYNSLIKLKNSLTGKYI